MIKYLYIVNNNMNNGMDSDFCSHPARDHIQAPKDAPAVTPVGARGRLVTAGGAISKPFPWVPLSMLIVSSAAGVCVLMEPELLPVVPVWFILYSKLDREKILDNYSRGKLYGFIQANPGEDCRTLMVKLALPHGTLLHHLKILERENLVRSMANGVHKLYFPANTTLPEDGPGRLTDTQEVVYGLISETPGVSQIELALRLGVSNVAVNYHLEALLEKDVIGRRRIGLRYRYFPAGAPGNGAGDVAPSVTPPA